MSYDYSAGYCQGVGVVHDRGDLSVFCQEWYWRGRLVGLLDARLFQLLGEDPAELARELLLQMKRTSRA